MRPLTYRNTTTDPRWSREPLHLNKPRGYGYENGTHYVHFGGNTNGLWTFDHGNAGTLAERKGAGGCDVGPRKPSALKISWRRSLRSGAS